MHPHPPVALITGAARRLGAATARHLHAQGYAIALHCHTSRAEADALAAELETARTGSVQVLQADLAQFDRLPELVAVAVGRFGRLDALVNNASAFFETPFGTTTPAQWDALLATNLRAPYFLAQAAAPHLRATRGAIVNLSDIHAREPRAGLGVYAITKGALDAMTRVLAVELAPGVRVNGVAPGAILWPEHAADPGLQAQLLARTPLGRTGEPDDIAAAVHYLIAGATYSTGTTLTVDGGRLA
ncbi:pteridine reductase [Luteimonas sp. BDR2-5]|uniref:pteridine reductase n=1 Tax=Proluteimonas luteida TaxID=2878685 RepID=UPI001E59CDFA|nr:pteridine reductase [Luteimonas sp. BDR2-5]MCD9029983.1 pteridine reductase [Luteimonas sp. BDR2-5]